MAKMLNPQTGATGEVSTDRLQEALHDGMQLAEPVQFFNPKTQGVGAVPPERAQEALADGLLAVGSHAHKVATTGTLEATARGAAQGASLGYFDELQAALRAPFSDRTYDQIRDEYRADDKIAEEAHPTASTLGKVGGGVATAFIPGLGLAKGASLLKMAGQGAVLGGLTGLGDSEADLTKGEVGQAALDAGKGALAGGAIGGTVGAVGQGMSRGLDALKGVGGKLVDPGTQRMLAMGAGKADLKAVGGEARNEITSSLKKLGIYDALPSGARPGVEDMAARVAQKKLEVGAKMSSIFNEAGDASVNVYDQLAPQLYADFDEIVKHAPPTMRESVAAAAEKVIDDVNNTGGELGGLWALKKDTGSWVGKAWRTDPNLTPPVKELYMRANGILNGVLDRETAQVAAQKNLPMLSELNGAYKALSAADTLLETKAASGAANQNLGFSFQDLSAGAAASGVGAAAFGPAGAMIGGQAGAIGSKYLNSTSGHLARADLGEALHKAQQAMSIQMGAIPRTTDGIKQWLTQHLAVLPPEMLQIAQTILQSPPTTAEAAIRGAMPLVAGQLAKSPYKSELDGKVSSPEDLIAARDEIKKLRLPPGQLAERLSSLNRDGTLPTEIFVPSPAPKPSFEDDVMGFNSRLKAAGY